MMPPLPQPVYLFPEINILVIGQSIASNCNHKIYGPINGVYQIARGGELKPASDPFEWADCKNGSMWMPLGKKLIEENIAPKIVFMPIGVGGATVRDWQSGGRAFDKLNTAIELIKKNNIRFDFAIWHQGSSDIGGDPVIYENRLSSVINYIKGEVKVDRWLIGLHSRCYGTYDHNIESAQIHIGNMNSIKYYVGANNNSLGDEYRIDTCHLNERGQESMATLWLNSIKETLR